MRVVTPDGALLDRPFITLPVMGDLERGLLGIAVHPDFRGRTVGLSVSVRPVGRAEHARARASRRRRRRAASPRRCSTGSPPRPATTTAATSRSRADGTLFVSLGEAHEPERAQERPTSAARSCGSRPTARCPADNPFGAANPVWSIGHRNSFGLCVDPGSGELWETENGPDRDDEVNLIEEGGNYGWPVVTGVRERRTVRRPGRRVPRAHRRRPGVRCSRRAVVRVVRRPGVASAGIRGTRSRSRGSPSGVTDVVLGPDGLVYVSTADAISTIDPCGDPVQPLPARTTRPPSGGDAVSGSGRRLGGGGGGRGAHRCPRGAGSWPAAGSRTGARHADDASGHASGCLGALHVGDGRDGARRGGLRHHRDQLPAVVAERVQDLARDCARAAARRSTPTRSCVPLPFRCSRWSVRRMQTPMMTSSPASLAMRYASSFTMPSCSQSTFAPIATASRAMSGVSSARRKTSTTSIGRSSGNSPQRRIRGLAEHLGLSWVHRHDAVAAFLQVGGHAERGPIGLRRQPDHRDRVGLAQQDAQLPVLGRHGVHAIDHVVSFLIVSSNEWSIQPVAPHTVCPSSS